MRKIEGILSISNKSVKLAHQRIFKTLDWVDAKLERAPYLFLDSEDKGAGSAFSALDLTMACYLAPLALPVEYGIQPGFLPKIEACPPQMANFVESVRDRAAIQWTLNMFRRYRRGSKG